MTNLNSETALIPASQAAKVIGADHRTFLRWLRLGRVSGVKISGSWFVHPSTLEAIRHRALIGDSFERFV